MTPEEVKRCRDAKVRIMAYHKWEQAGRPHGRELEFWLAGEQEYHTIHRRVHEALNESALPNYDTERNDND